MSRLRTDNGGEKDKLECRCFITRSFAKKQFLKDGGKSVVMEHALENIHHLFLSHQHQENFK